MRVVKIVGFVIGALILFQSCESGCPPESFFSYQFQNNSGHRVAVVLDELDNALPDSLVIPIGGTYKWNNSAQSPGFFPLRVNSEIKVYYDDDTKITFTGYGTQPRDPHNSNNFLPFTEIGKNLFLATYTFTVEDYEQAVLQNEM